MSFDSTSTPDVSVNSSESYSAAREGVAVVATDSVSVNDAAQVLFVAATEITTVPLSQLVPSSLNVRKVQPTGIKELAANIEAVGVLQNLVVHAIEPDAAPAKGKKAKKPVATVTYGVAAGRRRLTALLLLLEQGKIADSYPVPVKIVSDQEALLVSLSENQQREGMHPADQITAFAALKQEGRSVAYISAVFGVSELRVNQFLKLAGLSSELMELLRKNEIKLEQLYVLALADDHATQNRVWFGASAWDREPHNLRLKIVGASTQTAKCRAFKYVGADAFELAGGFILRDLFGGQNEGFIDDIELVERMASEKMAAELLQLGVSAEGWNWIEFYPRALSYEENEAYSTVQMERLECTDEQAAELDRIEAEQEQLQQLLEADADGVDEDSLNEQFNALDAAREAIEQTLCHWSDSNKAHAGVVAFLDGDGMLVVQRGRVRKSDLKAAVTSGNTVVDQYHRVLSMATADSTDKGTKAMHSEKLVQRLSAHRTAAVQAELIQQPAVALAVLAHRLACRVFGTHWQDTTRAVKIQLDLCAHSLKELAPDMTSSTAWRVRTEAETLWKQELPEDFTARVDWLLQWDQDKVVRFLAYLMAQGVNGIRQRDGADDMDTLAQLLNVDLTAYWQPTQTAYFDHINKAAMVKVVTEAVSAEDALPLAGMKKAEAAAAAAQLVEGTGWLPTTLTGVQPVAALDVADQDDDTE